MPIYEYRCQACGHEVEVLQKMSDRPLVDCPACGKATLSKMVSAAGFQLKGSGWYVTDFRDKKKAKDGAKKDGDAGGGDASPTKDSSGAGESSTTKSSDSKAEGSAKTTPASDA